MNSRLYEAKCGDNFVATVPDEAQNVINLK